MDRSLIIYNAALGAGCLALPALWFGSRLAGSWGDVWPRLGLYGGMPSAPEGPRVWLQAVSVGEVAVAEAIANHLWSMAPHVNLTVSTSTAKGLERAHEVFGGRAGVMAFPLDLPWSVAGAAGAIRPHVFASLETEIWPNLLALLDRRGAACLMLNGRISPRSYPGYRRMRWLMAPALGHYRRLSMITSEDARRVCGLGAQPGRVTVDGNAKYAGLLDKARTEILPGPKAVLNLRGAPLLVAGSVRTGEEDAVIGAFARVRKSHANAVLAVAPRHVERAPQWLEAARRAGLSVCAWSGLGEDNPRPRDCAVVVIDTMGALMALYGLAEAVFVGASLVPLGGQNPMEPAAWARPVAYGPDMDDFADARTALEQAGGGHTVAGAAELADFWQNCLDEPRRASQAGRAGREVVAGWSGAAKNAAELIMEHLDRKGVL